MAHSRGTWKKWCFESAVRHSEHIQQQEEVTSLNHASYLIVDNFYLFYYKIVHVVQNNEKNTRDNQK